MSFFSVRESFFPAKYLKNWPSAKISASQFLTLKQWQGKVAKRNKKSFQLKFLKIVLLEIKQAAL